MQRLIYRNLRLLILDHPSSTELRTVLGEDMFSVPNKTAFEHVMCFLLNILRNEKYHLRMPLVNRKMEADFRDAVYRFIKEIAIDFPEIQIPTFAPSAFKSPGGELIIKIILKVSTFVMLTCLKRDHKVANLLLCPVLNDDYKSNIKLNVLCSLQQYHNAQFHEKKSEFVEITQIIKESYSTLSDDMSKLDALIKSRSQHIETLLQNESVDLCPQTKKNLLDINDDSVITRLNEDVEKTWIKGKKIVVKLIEFEQQIEQVHNTVLAMTTICMSPICLDGSLICLPTTGSVDPQMMELIKCCKRNNRMVLYQLFELGKHCLKLKAHEINGTAIQDVSCVLPDLTALAQNYQRIQTCIQNSYDLLKEQHDQLILEDELSVEAVNIKLPFNATPPMAILTRDISNLHTSYGSASNLCIDAAISHKIYYKPCENTVHVTSNLLQLDNKSDATIIRNNDSLNLTASLKKQNQDEGKDIASIRKRMSVMRKELEFSVAKRSIQYANTPASSNLKISAKRVFSQVINEVDDVEDRYANREGILSEFCEPPAKESLVVKPKKIPTHSQFVIHSAQKRKQSHCRIIKPSKLTCPTLLDYQSLDEVVQNMMQDRNISQESILSLGEERTSLVNLSWGSGGTASPDVPKLSDDLSGIETLSLSFQSPVGSSTPSHDLYPGFRVVSSPDPVFHLNLPLNSPSEAHSVLHSNCNDNAIDKAKSSNVCKSSSSSMSESFQSKFSCKSSPEAEVSSSAITNVKNNSILRIVERFNMIKKNMNVDHK